VLQGGRGGKEATGAVASPAPSTGSEPTPKGTVDAAAPQTSAVALPQLLRLLQLRQQAS